MVVELKKARASGVYSAQSIPLIPGQSVPLKNIARGQITVFFYPLWLYSVVAGRPNVVGLPTF